MSRRRTRRNERMDAIRESADVPDRHPISDEEIDTEAQAQDDAAEEIATGIAELEAEGPMPPDGAGDEYDRDGPMTRQLFTADDVRALETFEPPFDPEIFERGPLAAGIRMCQALLTEAKAGYIEAQIGELERVLDLVLPQAERAFLARIASETVTVSELPDIAGAYQALVRAKAQLA